MELEYHLSLARPRPAESPCWIIVTSIVYTITKASISGLSMFLFVHLKKKKKIKCQETLQRKLYPFLVGMNNFGSIWIISTTDNRSFDSLEKWKGGWHIFFFLFLRSPSHVSVNNLKNRNFEYPCQTLVSFYQTMKVNLLTLAAFVICDASLDENIAHPYLCVEQVRNQNSIWKT